MTHLLRKLVACATLPSAFLLAAAASPSSGATPIANGHLKGGPTIATPVPSILDVTFHLNELPDGTVQGSGKLTKKSADGWMKFDLTSYVYIGDSVLVAGPVTSVQEGSEPSPWIVGATFFMVVEDGVTPELDRFIEGGVPPQFGNLTAEQILAVVGPPPSAIFRPALSGNLVIH